MDPESSYITLCEVNVNQGIILHGEQKVTLFLRSDPTDQMRSDSM